MFDLCNRLLGRCVYHEVIDCLVTALEARDTYTSGHSRKVADMTCELAKELGIKGLAHEDIHLAAHLHDIGKFGIPESILNKKGSLTQLEYAQIKRHPEIGYNILIKSKGLTNIAKIVLHHHERWDGKGYPWGLIGEEIPLGSRIIAVADSIDAMVSGRPYREAMDWEECKEELLKNKALQFDPVVVDVAVSLFPKWQKIDSKKRKKVQKEIEIKSFKNDYNTYVLNNN